MHVRDRYLKVFQQFKVGNVPILTQIVKDVTGNPLQANSNQLINKIQYYAGNYGIGDAATSLAWNNFADYFVDSFRGVVCRLSQNGIEPISILYNTNAFFVSNTAAYRKDLNNGVSDGVYTGDPCIYGVFDANTNKYIIAMEEINRYAAICGYNGGSAVLTCGYNGGSANVVVYQCNFNGGTAVINIGFQCTYNGGYTQVYSKITNYGNTAVEVILFKNSSTTAFTATAVAANSTAEIFLSGTTFTDTDSLRVNIVAGANNINVGSSPTILPNGGAALSYTSLTGQNSHSINVVFNGDASGWGVGGNMFWFNLTFTASAVG